MTRGLLCVLGHEGFEFRLGAFVLEVGLAGLTEDGGELRPGVGGSHVDDADGLNPGLWGLVVEEMRPLAGFDGSPERALGGEQDGLVDRVGFDGDFSPLAVTGDDGQNCRLGTGDQHVVLELGHVLFDRPFNRKRPRQHEFCFEDGTGRLDESVQGCGHERDRAVEQAPLHVADLVAGVVLIPAPVELLGGQAELRDQFVGKIQGLPFATLLLPQVEQGFFVGAHGDAGVGAANEIAPIASMHLFCFEFFILRPSSLEFATDLPDWKAVAICQLFLLNHLLWYMSR